MRLLMIELIKRARGGELRREHSIDAPNIRIGRGADCEVALPDPRVLLHHASVEFRQHGATLVAETEASLMINGRLQNIATLQNGDVVTIGPYLLKFTAAPSAEHDIAVEVTLTQPQADDLQALIARSGMDLTRVGMGKRGWSYLLFIVVALIFFAAPLAGRFWKPDSPQSMIATRGAMWLASADRLWNSGELSNPHKFFAQQCETCHQSLFVRVTDGACLACHVNIRDHADHAAAPMAMLKGHSCHTCHQEHTGPHAVVLRSDAFCTGCHADLQKQMPQTKLLDVSSFERSHPDFRPTVPADHAAATFHRVSLSDRPPPTEQSGLKFPHDKHLAPGGIRHPDFAERVVLDCAGCHRPDSGGVGMKPVQFEAMCHSCHKLRFDAAFPNREMPHGSATAAKAAVADIYAAAALRGEIQEPEAPDIVKRRRPGQVLTDQERLEAIAWAEQKTKTTLTGKFGQGMCGECHAVQTAADGLFEIRPPALADRFMPKGAFPHARHREVPCADCHAAKTSTAATDLLVPGIDNCRSCHGGVTVTDKVPSACISCHKFHNPGMPLMRGVHAASGSQSGTGLLRLGESGR